MGLRLYLVRHGETNWNAVGKFQGHSDVPLSEVGRRQAARLAQYLKNIKIDVVLASDLKRALETAQIVSGKPADEIITDLNLREINFGHWEGLTYDEINASYGEILQKWRKEPLNTRIPGGEVFSEVAERTTAAVQKIIDQYPNKNVLVVSHGAAIRAIICSIMGIDLNKLWRMYLDNCSLSIIHFPDNNINNGLLQLYNAVY